MYTPDIIYEDADILICRKPAGMAVQTKRLGQQDMETGLKNYLVRKKEKPYIGVVHRLDQPVEGIMVFAKNPKATAELSRQVQGREIGKYYYAIGCRKRTNKNNLREKPETNETTSAAAETTASTVAETTASTAAETTTSTAVCDIAGIPASGTLTDYLGFDAKKNLGYISTDAAAGKNKNIKKAILDYRLVAPKPATPKATTGETAPVKPAAGETATVKPAASKTEAGNPTAGPEERCFDITLHTGRHHQIRLQLAHLGYPLLGDTKYGGPEADQLALCSYRINFRHPANGKNMDFRIKPLNPAFIPYL